MQPVPAGQQQNKDDVPEKTYELGGCCLSFCTCGGKEELRLYAHTLEYKKTIPCLWPLFCSPPFGPLNFACPFGPLNFAVPNQVFRTKVPYSEIKYVQHNSNCFGESVAWDGMGLLPIVFDCGSQNKAKSIYEDLMFKATPDSPGQALSMSRN